MERVKSKKVDLRLVFHLFLFVSLSLLITACSKHVSKKWQEEVALGDGRVIWINRTTSYMKHPKALIGERRGLTKLELTIDIPANPVAPAPPQWKFDAIPILLDYDQANKTWFIIAAPLYCDSWVKAGKPQFRNWQYEVENGQWVVKPLNKKLVGRDANLLSGTTNDNVVLDKVTIKEIEKYNRFKEGYNKVEAKEPNCSR